MSPLSHLPATRKREVPISLLQKPHAPQRWIVEPSTAQIQVKGSPDLLEKLEETSFADIRVFADLIEAPATNLFRVALEWHAPENLEVEIIDPPQAEAKVRLGQE